MARAIATCDCPCAMKQLTEKIWNPESGTHSKQVEFKLEHEGETCQFCGYYVVFFKPKDRPELVSLTEISDAEFKQDLNEHLDPWGYGSDWEDFGYGNRRRRKLA